MRQVTIEHDINIAVNGCSGLATSTQKGPFMAMLISHSGGTCLISYSNLSTVAFVPDSHSENEHVNRSHCGGMKLRDDKIKDALSTHLTLKRNSPISDILDVPRLKQLR